MLIDYIIIFEKAFNSVINNSFKNFADVRKEGNRSVVGTLCSVILFKYRTYISNFEKGGKTSLCKRLINNYLKWGAEVIGEFFEKIGWDTVKTRGLEPKFLIILTISVSLQGSKERVFIIGEVRKF